MKIGKRDGENERKSFTSGPITAQTYVERAKSWMIGGDGFVIRSFKGSKGAWATHQPATEPQWVAWVSYFAQKEIPFAFAVSHGLATVPCEWPENFDLEAPMADRRATLPPPEPEASPEQRQRVLNGLRKISRALEANGETKDNVARRRTLLEIAEDYRANPVGLSAGAAKAFGIDLSSGSSEFTS